MDGWTDQRERETNQQTQTDRWMDGWMDGWIDGWMEKSTERPTVTKKQMHRHTQVKRNVDKCTIG